MKAFFLSQNLAISEVTVASITDEDVTILVNQTPVSFSRFCSDGVYFRTFSGAQKALKALQSDK